MRYIPLALAALLSCGCSAVYSPKPIGGKPVNIESSAAEWEGTWTHADGAVTIKVTDGSNGVLKVGWVEEAQADLKCLTADVFLRRGGAWTLASIRPQQETNQNRYVWGRVEKKDRVIVFWGPDVAKFKALVRDGKIPGSLDGSDVVLGVLASNHLQMITSEAEGVLLDWDEPFVLFKLSK